MTTRKVVAIRKAKWDWKAPTLAVLGALVGTLATYAWMAMHLAHPEPLPTPPETTAALPPHSTQLGAPMRAVRGQMTHPIIACVAADPNDHTLLPLQTAVQAIVTAAKAKQVDRVAVHIADLETCVTMRTAPAELFHPASMMKLPLALAWLRRTGLDPHALAQRLTHELPASADVGEDPNAQTALHQGESYTVEDLLQRMLVDSRNDAKYVLAQAMPPTEQDGVWRDLGLTPPLRDRDPEITVDAMALMYHALYDGAWLGRDVSEMALRWLAVASWKDGLLALLPPDAVAAHKYGRRALEPTTRGQRVQLHDCGIVYRASHPMVVCVMTDGTNEKAAEQTIQQIAKAAWDFPTN